MAEMEWVIPGWPEEANSVQFQYHHSSCLLPWLPQLPHASMPFHVLGFPPSTAVEDIGEDRATASSKSHSQAEKRRRERINAHLATLRRLIPCSDKLDKAALLRSVVDQVKDLKRKVVEIGEAFTIPTDVDEVIVDCSRQIDPKSSDKKDSLFIKASVCCDDRPELFPDLIKALEGLKLRTVRVDMATLGGRVRNVFILSTKDSDSEEGVCLSSLKQSLKVVLSRVVSSSTVTMNGHSSKRQRLLLPSSYSD